MPSRIVRGNIFNPKHQKYFFCATAIKLTLKRAAHVLERPDH